MAKKDQAKGECYTWSWVRFTTRWSDRKRTVASQNSQATSRISVLSPPVDFSSAIEKDRRHSVHVITTYPELLRGIQTGALSDLAVRIRVGPCSMSREILANNSSGV